MNGPPATLSRAGCTLFDGNSSSATGAPPATITDDLVVSHKYFSEAVALAPQHLRFEGFRAGIALALGSIDHDSIDHDEKRKRRGYFDLLAAKDGYPEINLFTAG